MSVSPSGSKRKARDSNPNDLAVARFSGPTRPTVSGCHPYRVDAAGVEPALPARQAGIVPLDHRPVPIRGVGVEPTLSGAQGRRITTFLPPVRVDRRGIAPRSPPCDDGVFLLDEQPSLSKVQPGIEPGLPRLPGWRAARTPPDHKLRRPDLNRRRTAYETVLETKLQSTPQSVPPAGLEPATARM